MPGFRGDAALRVGYSFAHGKKPRQLRAAQLAEAIKRPHAGIRIDLHQIKIDAFKVLLLKPIQQLKKLQLIVKIMLKPEHHVLVLAEILERPVAAGKVGAKFFRIAPAETGKRLCPNIR